MLPELVRRGIVPDVVTDQTSAHDPLNGYVPHGVTLDEAAALRRDDPKQYMRAVAGSRWRTHVRAMLRPAAARRGHLRLRQQPARPGAESAASTDAFDIPGFVPAYIRPLFCEGKGPFRWAALSGDPDDIARHRRRGAASCSPRTSALHRWISWPHERVAVPGPARAHLLARLRRARTARACASTSWCATGKVKAPIVIGRDHLDAGSVASPNRETEAMKDGSDAIADWPILNALVNTAAGATWVSVHHGGGVGIGYSLHAGMVVVADGTRRRRARGCERVLTTDPGMGVMRHADAGYERGRPARPSDRAAHSAGADGRGRLGRLARGR